MSQQPRDPKRSRRGPRPSPPALSSKGKLQKPSRVRRRQEYVRIQSGGLRVRTSGFTVIAKKNDGTRARFGCAVSKKVGHAPTRNRVKRLLREIFRRAAHELPKVDYVVIAKPPAADLAWRGLAAVLEDLGPALIEAGQRAEAAR